MVDLFLLQDYLKRYQRLLTEDELSNISRSQQQNGITTMKYHLLYEFVIQASIYHWLSIENRNRINSFLRV